MIVLVIVDGEFTVKRLDWRGTRMALFPENPLYQPIELQDDQEL